VKIYHAINEHSPDIPDKDKEKMSILKLVEVGKYIKNVGIRDGQFYVIADDATDEVYLEYREAMHNIDLAMRKKIDIRLMNEKAMEYHNKKNIAMQKFMETPRD
jgi:hypothetical protein